MDEPRRHRMDDRRTESSVGVGPVAAWRAAKSDPDYPQEAARQAASAAFADVEDRVMEWIDGVATESWDDP